MLNTQVSKLTEQVDKLTKANNELAKRKPKAPISGSGGNYSGKGKSMERPSRYIQPWNQVEQR